jgi:septal ring factor EnvC (AmiA/AmiB activator)
MESDHDAAPAVPYWRWLEGQLAELSTELGRVTDERDQTVQELDGAKQKLNVTAQKLDATEQKLEEAVQELERLRARLRKYENPHTPSSAVRFKKAAPVPEEERCTGISARTAARRSASPSA